MNDLMILHLSDLHIDGTGRCYSKLLKNLINDIKEQKESYADGKVVVVITGDIINQGNKSAINNAKKFLKDLRDVLADKVIGLYIVPGNHDKFRTDSNKILIPAYRYLVDNTISYNDNNDGKSNKDGKTKIRFEEGAFDQLWLLQNETYKESGYVELLDYIYDELFVGMDEMGKVSKKTYGVHVLTVNNKKYCFILLNTAWCCIDDHDTRHLVLGEFQISEISKQFRDLTDEENIDLTFVIGHHPIECLHGSEQDQLFQKMTGANGIDANVYLCGHTHDRTVVNWSNNRHTINTLVTGIGWPEAGGVHFRDHYYSIYDFNLDINSMDIYVRNTDDDGKFSPDMRIYTRKRDNKEEKLVRPIRFENAIGEIKFRTGVNVPTKAMYASNEFLEYSVKFSHKLMEIVLEARSWIEDYINDFYEVYYNSETTDDEIFGNDVNNLLQNHMYLTCVFPKTEYECNPEIKKLLENHLEIIYENFQSYIQKMCERLHNKLVEDVDENQVVRFHFRYLHDRISYVYPEFCSSFSCKQDTVEYTLSEMKYGDLLEAIIKSNQNHHGCLIYSVNQKLCQNKLKDKWRNFVTIIPKFTGNIYHKKVNDGYYKDYPFLTFGVTINSEAHDYLLYCMDYYSLDEVIGDMLQMYIDVFEVNVDKFCSWVKKEAQKEDDVE